MQKRLLFILAGCLSMFGCRPITTHSDYIQIHESARTALPLAVQIEELFGDADHFITHFGFDRKPKVWNTEVYFGGRYSLTMQVDVAIDYSANTLKQVGTPTFYLVEYTEVETSPTGGLGASSREPKGGRIFSAAKWKKVFKSDGDFSKIGITILKDPVPRFDEFVAAKRRPRRPISLVDEKEE